MVGLVHVGVEPQLLQNPLAGVQPAHRPVLHSGRPQPRAVPAPAPSGLNGQSRQLDRTGRRAAPAVICRVMSVLGLLSRVRADDTRTPARHGRRRHPPRQARRRSTGLGRRVARHVELPDHDRRLRRAAHLATQVRRRRLHRCGRHRQGRRRPVPARQRQQGASARGQPTQPTDPAAPRQARRRYRRRLGSSITSSRYTRRLHGLRSAVAG